MCEYNLTKRTRLYAIWEEAVQVVNITEEQAVAGIAIEIFDEAKVNDEKVLINIGVSSVKFDAEAVSVIGEHESVTFTMSLSDDVSEETIDGAEKVLNISLSVTFADGKATVKVPFTVQIPDGKIVKVYYVDAQGNKTDMNATLADNMLSFETNHFSKYVVAVENEFSYTVSFNANGGEGTMADVSDIYGEYQLPACTFTAPEGMEFKCWMIDETEYQVGANINVTDNVELKAVWQEVAEQKPVLSAGVVAIIAVASAVAVGAIGFFVYWYRRKRSF